MQTGAILLGQFDGLTRRGQTSLLATNQCMQTHLRVFTPGLLHFLHIAVDDVGILTMGHQWQFAGLKDTFQRLLTVYQHVTRRRTHEEFHSRNTCCIQLGKAVGIIVCGAIEERIVHMALLRGQLKLLFKGFQCGGLRHTIGHVKITGHATCCCRTALTVDIGLLRQSGLTEMHVVVDNAR